MASLEASKRACEAQLIDPLSNAGILEHVLAYADPRVWLYLGAVSSLWKHCYEKVVLEAARRVRQRAAVTEVPRETTYRSVMQSVATLTWAYTSGLTVDAPRVRGLQYAAGRYASLLTLAVAHELGLPMSTKVFAGAVASDRPLIVKHLSATGTHYCPMAEDIGYQAAQSGNVGLLKYLKRRGLELRASLACKAAPAGHLDAMKYLRSEGCSWLQDTQVIGWAAQSGNLEMVNSVPWYMFVSLSTISSIDC
jgi:hypothetical protein